MLTNGLLMPYRSTYTEITVTECLHPTRSSWDHQITPRAELTVSSHALKAVPPFPSRRIPLNSLPVLDRSHATLSVYSHHSVSFLLQSAALIHKLSVLLLTYSDHASTKESRHSHFFWAQPWTKRLQQLVGSSICPKIWWKGCSKNKDSFMPIQASPRIDLAGHPNWDWKCRDRSRTAVMRGGRSQGYK